jgi:hypothetical protein
MRVISRNLWRSPAGRRCLIAHGLLLSSVAFMGCATYPPSQTQPTLCASLEGKPIPAKTTFLYLPESKIASTQTLLSTYSIKPVEMQRELAATMGDLNVYHVTFQYTLASYTKYCELHDVLVSDQIRFPLDLNWIEVTSQYTSLEGAIGLKITFVGATTKNATLQVRYAGNEWRPVPDEDGRYSIENFPIVKGHDYIFARIWMPTEGDPQGKARYVKLNVFGPSEEEGSSPEEYDAARLPAAGSPTAPSTETRASSTAPRATSGASTRPEMPEPSPPPATPAAVAVREDGKVGLNAVLTGRVNPGTSMTFKYAGKRWAVNVGADGSYSEQITVVRGEDFVFAKAMIAANGGSVRDIYVKFNVFSNEEKPSSQREFDWPPPGEASP